MALTEKLAILITGDASGAIAEMKKLAGETEKNLGKAGGEVGKFSQNATKIGAGMVGVGTGLLAVGLSAASTTTDLGREVLKLQRYTGMNAEEASKLAYAAKMSGVDVESLATGIGKLSKTMANTPDKLEKFGVQAKGTDGHLRSMTDVLGDVAEKFHAMGPGTEATAASLDLFGRSGANLLPFLLKGRDGIAELSAEAEKMGLVLSQDNVDQVKANIVAQRQLHAAIDGVKVQIGNQMLPVLTKFTDLMTGLPGPVKEVAGPIVVLGGAVLVTGGAFLLMAGQVQKAKTAFANLSTTSQVAGKIIGGLSTGLAVGMTVWSIYTQRVNDAQAASQQFADNAISDAAKGGIDAARQQVEKFGASVAQYHREASGFGSGGKFWFWDRATAEGNEKTARKNQQAMQSMIDQANAIGGAMHVGADAAFQWLSSQREAGNTFPSTEAALAAYTGQIDTNTLSTEDAKAAQEGYAAAIKQASDALRATVDPYFAVTKGKRDLDQATKDLHEAETKYAADSPEVQTALENQIDAGLGLEEALGKLGTAQKDGSASTKTFSETLDLLRTMGIDPSSAAGQALIEKITGVGTTADATAAWLATHPLGVKTDDTQLDAFMAKWGHLGTLVGHGLSIVLSANTWLPEGLAPGSASGGFLPQGRPTLVGEYGPEMFIPSSSGTVMTSLSTAHALSGGGGGGVTIEALHVSLPNVINGDQFVDELQRYVRRNGPLPLAVA